MTQFDLRCVKRGAMVALATMLLGGSALAQAPGGRLSPQNQTPPAITALSGGWDLIGQEGQRKCRLTLRPQEAKGGRALGFPATCRRALPILSRIAAWSVSDDGFLRLNDAQGGIVLAFEDDPQALKLKATADGQSFQIDSLGKPRRFIARTVAAAPAPPRVPFDPARAPSRESIPGLYGMVRYGGLEVCRITLGTSPGASEGRFLTSYPTRCRDRGLEVFDVVAWRYAGGRLFLIARRGHEMTMVPTSDGVWQKDPPAGAELTLRRLGN